MLTLSSAILQANLDKTLIKATRKIHASVALHIEQELLSETEGVAVCCMLSLCTFHQDT